MSRSTRLVASIVPGINRQPLKKLAADETALLQLLYCWLDEATKAGRTIDRIAVAYEAGRDGFWLARWLRGRGHRGLCDPPDKCCRVARASPGEDGFSLVTRAGQLDCLAQVWIDHMCLRPVVASAFRLTLNEGAEPSLGTPGPE
jgi:hypothetical protein